MADARLTDLLRGEQVDLAFAALSAGIYLVVRGIDNIEQGATGTRRDPILERARRMYNNIGPS